MTSNEVSSDNVVIVSKSKQEYVQVTGNMFWITQISLNIYIQVLKLFRYRYSDELHPDNMTAHMYILFLMIVTTSCTLWCRQQQWA